MAGGRSAAVADGAEEFVTPLQGAYALLRVAPRLEVAGKGLGHYPFIAAPILAEQQAKLFGLDDAGSAAGLAVVHEGIGDIARHPLLIGETMADGVHEAGDPAETMQTPAGQVGDMGKAAEIGRASCRERL